MDDGGPIKRKAPRKDFSCDIKVRFSGQDFYTTIAVKDISVSGVRAIVPRLIKVGDSLEIKMNLNGREIDCKGKVAWILLLRLSLGNISSFDTGIEFYEMNSEDQEFLAKLV
ncbi:MAG TPA: PilZ domain-containing protein [Candidatus Omnitrophota bacterium]|nr:PilZ domain-containing protein [Candidatus Omnitrophota bacterium]HPT39138.1 PilZ domain-containing protein [Candidatus Omnitrophota bacterium]